MIRPPLDRGQAGLTLIEVLVVVVLTGILSVGLYAMTAGQSRTYSGQLTSLGTQQNVWGAMEYLQRQIRMAGYGFGGCPSGVVKVWDGVGALTNSLASGFQGFNSCQLYNYSVTNGGLLPPNAAACNADGVDSFAVGYSTKMMSGQLSSVRLGDGNCCHKSGWNCKAFDGSNMYLSSCSSVKNGDLMVLWEPGLTNVCTMIQATADCKAKDGKVNINPGTGINPPPGKRETSFPPYDACTTQVINLGSMQDALKFSIDNNSAVGAGVPRLVQWRAANRADLEVIADGIEDMQLSWACDVNNNNILEEGTSPLLRQTDEWANNATPDTDPCVGGTVKAVRLTLVGRAASAETGNNTGFRPGGEDRVAGTTAQDLVTSGGAGTFRRVTLTSTIKLRNMR